MGYDKLSPMGYDKLSPTTTLVMAASNSSKSGKALAGVVCTGTNDHTTINDALNALPAGVAAKVIFLVGTYSLAGPVILDRDWLTIEGEQHPIEATGRELRKLMAWVKSHDSDYVEGSAAR